MPKTQLEDHDYYKNFHEKAKAHLPQWQFNDIHLKARGASGGKTPRTPDTQTSSEVALSDLTSGEVHVPVPLGSARQRVKRRTAAASKTESTLADAALQADTGPLLATQRLLAGTDLLMNVGDYSPDEALALASEVLASDPSIFNGVAVADNPALMALDGLDLDLGSGTQRDPGYFGIDTYPYDDATVVHDLALGIPFPDASARSVRLVNAFDDIVASGANPEALLADIARVLMPGGRLIYQGPSPGIATAVAGMTLMAHDDFAPAGASDTAPPGSPVHQEFERDAGDEDMATAADRIALAALSGTDTGRVSKSDTMPRYIPILKTDTYKQIVYGVVLAPHEIDTQSDYMSPEDIEATAHKYLEDARVIKSEHTDDVSAFPVESFIAPQDLNMTGPYGPQTVKQGSWVLAVKIVSPKEWQKVLDGEYSGFSVGGFGLRDTI